MSTVAEIEAALAGLSPDDLGKVQAALHRLQQNGGRTQADIMALEHANGFDALPKRDGGRVTVETVRQLCAEEGI